MTRTIDFEDERARALERYCERESSHRRRRWSGPSKKRGLMQGIRALLGRGG